MSQGPMSPADRHVPAVSTPGAESKIPAHYGDPRAEYQALTRTAGFVDRGARGRLRVTGAERIPFLQGLLTSDLRQLAPGRGLYTVHADQHGRIVADLWVHDRGDHLLIETEPELAGVVLSTISNYIVVEDVVVKPEADAAATIGLDGPRAAELAAAVMSGISASLASLETVSARFEGGDVLVLARETPVAGRSPALDVTLPRACAPALWQALDDAARAMGGRAAGQAAAESLRLERGIPRGGVDLDREVIVLEARLERVVSWDKGCYLGQETIAKMHYRGKPRQLLVSLLLEAGTPAEAAAPPRDTPLFAGDDRIGRITTSTWSFGLDRWIALGYVRRDLGTDGTRLTIAAPDGPVAEVHEPGTLLPAEAPAT